MKRKITQLAAFLLSVIMVVCYAPAVFAATDDGTAIHLSDSDNGVNVPFSADNMFPGDAVSKDYVIEVSHKEPVTLFFHADIRPGYEKLAEVLKLKVSLPDKDTELYDGLMRDMPQALEHQLASSEKSVTYRLTVYLDTSVGNDYQYKDLIADFRWWYLEEEPNPVDPPETDPAYVKLVAEKLLDSQYARGSTYSFSLSDSSGAVIQTVKNEDGDIEFDTLRFTSAGNYTYYIKETIGTDKNIEYDDSVYEVTITVNESSDTYVATVSYEKDGAAYSGIPRFTNKTKDAPGVPTDPTEPGGEDNNPVVPENPKTGDNSSLWLYIFMMILSLGIMLFLLLTRKRTLDLNGKKPVITKDNGIITPGMTRDMPFYIQNNMDKDISFKLYCSHKSPALANLLDVTILNKKGVVLCSGKLSALTQKNVPALTSSLDKGQRVDWTARFHLPMGAADSQAELHFELAYADVEKKAGKAGGDHE